MGDGWICAVCGQQATCIGIYERDAGAALALEMPACDDCCAHGNEDGHCRPIAPAPDAKEGG